MLIEGQFPVAAPPHLLLQHLFDARLMASCLPGCEELEPLTDDRYRAVVVVAMAGIKARFDLQVEITRKDEHNVWATTRGEEGGNASTLQAESQLTLQADGADTLVNYRSDVSVTGRLGRFALGMMKKKAQSLGNEFALNLQNRLQQLSNANTVETDVHAAARQAVPPPASASMEATNANAPSHESDLAATRPRSWWRAFLSWLRGERKPRVVNSGN
jgi:carbon monoxide dehydrogenase subunit G